MATVDVFAFWRRPSSRRSSPSGPLAVHFGAAGVMVIARAEDSDALIGNNLGGPLVLSLIHIGSHDMEL